MKCIDVKRPASSIVGGGRRRRDNHLPHGPAVGAHARIRTGDRFLTNWSSVPGEFDPILALPAISAETIYLRQA